MATCASRACPSSRITLGDLAARANPLRGAVKPGSEPGLEATDYFGPRRGATASGVHAMIVEVDPETMRVEDQQIYGRTRLRRGDQSDDPGGADQGAWPGHRQCLLRTNWSYDEGAGNAERGPLTDYLMPRAMDMPTHRDRGILCTPSPLNPDGVQGRGRGRSHPDLALLLRAGGRERARG